MLNIGFPTVNFFRFLSSPILILLVSGAYIMSKNTNDSNSTTCSSDSGISSDFRASSRDSLDSPESEPTLSTQLSYVRLHDQCPYCGGTDLNPVSEFENTRHREGLFIRQKCECENCGREWWDVFRLSHIEEYKEYKEPYDLSAM